VVRTAFLLQYVSDIELRQVIQAATNKSEALNKFVQWVCFGGEGVIAENIEPDRRQQPGIFRNSEYQPVFR
jgi:TnpA family transposase